jgi:cob(I)alamin adenosyltransferase
LIHAYTGDGKGKTTAAVGLLIRAFGSGKNVCVVFFDKGSETYRHSELVVLDRLNIEYHLTGLERMKENHTFRFGTTEEDLQEARRGLEIAEKLIKSCKYDLIVLDEALTSVDVGLIKEKDLVNLIQTVPEDVELVLTGRSESEKLLDMADLVTSMVKQKHYFDQGVKARQGIEY